MVRRSLRYVYRKLLPVQLKKSLDLFQQLRSAAANSPQPRTEVLPEKNIIVLSPHPDDDIFGCGGTLYRYHLNGAAITTVYLTDGRKGTSFESEGLVQIRREEAKKAAEIIGINKLIFLDNTDGKLTSTQQVVSEIARLVNAIRPDAVYLPFLLDNHPDHLATNDIFMKASDLFADDPICYGYEVWTPLCVSNWVVDITKELPVKLRAIEQHASQLKELNLLNAFLGLSRYRSVISGLRNGNAEAFMRCTLSEYRRLWRIAR